MTVKEAIEQLKKHEPNAILAIPDVEWGYYVVEFFSKRCKEEKVYHKGDLVDGDVVLID